MQHQGNLEFNSCIRIVALVLHWIWLACDVLNSFHAEKVMIFWIDHVLWFYVIESFESHKYIHHRIHDSGILPYTPHLTSPLHSWSFPWTGKDCKSFVNVWEAKFKSSCEKLLLHSRKLGHSCENWFLFYKMNSWLLWSFDFQFAYFRTHGKKHFFGN